MTGRQTDTAAALVRPIRVVGVRETDHRVALLLRILVVATTTTGLLGCSALPFRSGSPAVNVAGAWTGAAVVDGGPIPGVLTLRQSGMSLQATFVSADGGVQAEGSGEVFADGTVEIRLSYDIECPGTATFRGTYSDADEALAGTILASDCTGRALGSFEFIRGDEAGAGARGR